MKPTQRKDAFRNIYKKIVSYLSICLVIMLGLGGLLSTRYMCAGMLEKGMQYYDDRQFEDFEFVSSHGISDANIHKISAIPGVTAAEGVMQADGNIAFGDTTRKVVIMTTTSKVSIPKVTDGRLPSARGECMIGEDCAEVTGLKLGDKVSISLTGLDMDDPLVEHECTITGLMAHPNYIARKTIMTVCLPMEAFDSKITHGMYTRAYVRIDQPEGVNPLSDEYYDETAEMRNTLDALTDELAADRAQEMKDEANAEIDAEWQKALEELAAAQSEIDANEAELYARLDDALADLKAAEGKLAKESAKAKKEIREAEALIKAAEKKLSAGWAEYNAKKKQYDAAAKKFRKMFGKDLNKALKELEKLKSLLDKVDKFIKDYEEEKGATEEEVNAAIKDTGIWILDNEDIVKELFDYIGDKDARKDIKKLDILSDTDITEYADDLNELGYDKLMEIAEKMADGKVTIKEFKAYRNQINKAIKLIEQFQAAAKQLADGLNKLNAGEKELKAKKGELEDAKKEYAEETAKAKKKIKAGWNQYYAEKRNYEGKLEDAKALLATNREEAEKALKEARAEVDKIECSWIMLDRMTNAGYMDLRSNIGAITDAGVIFGILFIIITAIVCFSTLTIIIEEQKPLVGTVKAFGFLRNEILGKYLVFGVSAAVLGSILGTALSYGVSEYIQSRFAAVGMYSFGKARSIITVPDTALASVGMAAVCVIATVIACSGILKSPASVLMKGGSINDNRNRRKSSSRRGGSLYSKLILRNMLDDKARVIISIAIIAFSCMLMGMGISMKMAFDGMINKEISSINKYDIRMDMTDDIKDKDVAKLYEVLDREGVSYLPAAYETCLYRWDGRLDAMYLVCADEKSLGDYIAVGTGTGDAVDIPDNGILVQHRLDESFGIGEGTELTVVDSDVKSHQAEVKGTFYNYIGRMAVVSPEAYKQIFGKAHDVNSCYIKLNGKDAEQLQQELISVTSEISFEPADEVKRKFAGSSMLYNIVVYVTTGIAILMSFMILTNLANIFLSRKKTELIIMRVNGFSIGQTIGYLARETVITTLAGLVLGVLSGALFTPILMQMMQQPDMQFYNIFHVKAWVIAAGLEIIFSLLINGVVFHKVRSFNLRDIA